MFGLVIKTQVEMKNVVDRGTEGGERERETER